MTVDIVGCTHISCFLFSGEFLLNIFQLGGWDDYSVIKDIFH